MRENLFGGCLVSPSKLESKRTNLSLLKRLPLGSVDVNSNSPNSHLPCWHSAYPKRRSIGNRSRCLTVCKNTHLHNRSQDRNSLTVSNYSSSTFGNLTSRCKLPVGISPWKYNFVRKLDPRCMPGYSTARGIRRYNQQDTSGRFRIATRSLHHNYSRSSNRCLRTLPLAQSTALVVPTQLPRYCIATNPEHTIEP